MDIPFFSEITALRRKFHQIPEIAGKEFKTCALIRETLAGIDGIEVLPPFLETDTVVLLRGEKGDVHIQIIYRIRRRYFRRRSS